MRAGMPAASRAAAAATSGAAVMLLTARPCMHTAAGGRVISAFHNIEAVMLAFLVTAVAVVSIAIFARFRQGELTY